MNKNDAIKDNHVLILNGAIRINGNTDTILKTIVEGAVGTGININQINLRKKIISDCPGCFHCHENAKCSQKDDMADIREEINKSELIIFASPLYWWGVPGKMKTFIDRLYFYHSSHNKKLIAGKKAMVFSPMNMNSDNPRIDIFKNFYDILFDNLDLKFVGGYYFGNVNEKGALVKRSEYMEQINDLGKNLNQYFD